LQYTLLYLQYTPTQMTFKCWVVTFSHLQQSRIVRC
jgi:hypothetical protein